MEMSFLLPIMLALGYVVAGFGLASTWARFGPGNAHVKNPLETLVQALISCVMLVHAVLLTFFQASVMLAVLILGGVILTSILNTAALIFVESRRGQLGLEYYLHTQIVFFFW